MTKPVCVACERFMRPKKNGFAWIEGMPASSDVPPGKRLPSAWFPYKLWSSDLWECPDCGAQVVLGHALRPRAEHYQPDFADKVREAEAWLLVKDC